MTTCATQTLADLAARLGNEAKARMVLGNFNNLVAFRGKDRPTQEYVVEQLGKAYIQSVSGSYTTHTDEHLAEILGERRHDAARGARGHHPRRRRRQASFDAVLRRSVGRTPL